MVGKFLILKRLPIIGALTPKPLPFYNLEQRGLTSFMTLSEKKKVLLAEDDSSMRRFIEIILQKAGFDVLTAEDGLIAMQIALEAEIDAIVADAIMPNMSGYDLCRMLRTRKIPCIILSGLAENNSDTDLADVFLTKDTNLKEQLLAALEKLL
jgi:CheY-like chemotaxis protein